MTQDEFKIEAPELFAQVRDAGIEQGKKAAQAEFAKLMDACGGDAALAAQCFVEGKSEFVAAKMHAEKLSKKLKRVKLGALIDGLTDAQVDEYANEHFAADGVLVGFSTAESFAAYLKNARDGRIKE